MNLQQNTTEQQHLDDLVKLIKLGREKGTLMAENDGRNDHQVNFPITKRFLYMIYH